MAVRKPLVQVSGALTELPAADNINIAASDIASGVINVNRLATNGGAANTTTFLRGDSAWALPPTPAGFTFSSVNAVPNGAVNVSRMLVSAATANGDIVLQPKGTGSLLAQLPDNAAAGGNKRGINSVDWQTSRTLATQVASGDSAIIGGGTANRASAGWAAVLSGNTNVASQTGAIVGGGRFHTASGSYSAVLGGDTNTANANFSAVLGGNSNVASGSYSTVSGGQSNTSSGDYSTVIGGVSNTASGELSVAMGNQANALAYGAVVQASGAFATAGDCQFERFVMRRQTTTNAASELFLNGSAAGAGQRMTIANDSTYTFRGIVTARRTDADNESAGWRVEGVIDNNANTVAFVGTPTVTSLGDDSAGVWTVEVQIDNVNNYLKLTVTGQNSKTIRWGATVELMRVTG